MLDLHEAIIKGKTVKAFKLLDDKNKINELSEFDYSPIMESIIHKRWEIFKLLLSKDVDLNIKNFLGETALHFSVAPEMPVKFVELLLKYNININCKNDNEETPLHWAAIYSNTPALKLLLEKGAQVNVKDINGNTPLHNAVKSSCIESVKVLIKYKVKLDSLNNNQQTPLSLTIGIGNIAEIKSIFGEEAFSTNKDFSIEEEKAEAKRYLEIANILNKANFK